MKFKVVAVCLIAVFILTACGGKTAGGPVEIKVMMWGSPEELAVWQSVADDFTAKNPSITVSMDVADWDSYWEKLSTLYAANTPPDLFAMDAPLFMDWYSRDTLLSLQSYIDEDPELFNGLYPVTVKAYETDKGYFGLPRDCQTIVLFYNKDMFDAAGQAYPDGTWTYDTLRQVAKALTKDTNGDGVTDQWGFSTDLWDMELFWSEAIWAFGGEIISDDHTQTLLTEGKARDAWHFINSMMVDDKSIPNPDEAAQFGGDAFDAGVAAMATMGHWAVPQYSSRGFAFDVAPMPTGPEGQATSVNSAGFVIAKNAAHPDEAWNFIKYVLSMEGQTKLVKLGFAVPAVKSIAESDTFLNQPDFSLNQQVFVDALSYAHMKPVFKGYDQWASIVGDNLIPVWLGEKTIDAVLDEIKPAADEVLSSAE
jgi:multiple sugar transport system substrate-binding protein